MLLLQGDRKVIAYEIADEHPYFFSLSNYIADSLHQALAFLPKRQVDVRNVEFAKALRLTTTKVEPVSFTVPRIKVCECIHMCVWCVCFCIHAIVCVCVCLSLCMSVSLCNIIWQLNTRTVWAYIAKDWPQHRNLQIYYLYVYIK